ncbi:MAG: PD-(D/E)XK nuclease family protein [Leadbetterella sp.]
MKPFLQDVAECIFSNHTLDSLQDLVMVLPNKRSTNYFKKYLSSCSDQPFFAPKIISIDDYLVELSGLTLITNLELYVRMFEIYKELDEEISFPKFLTWIPTLISDIESIDFELIDKPANIFKYLSEDLQLKHWQPNESHTVSEITKNYFDFFTKAGQLYFRIQQDLIQKKMCYRAMAYRKVAENIDVIFSESTTPYHYFVGLNALSKCEEVIIKNLIFTQKAKVYWDSDPYFFLNKNKAGKKLSLYKDSGKYGEWSIEHDDLKRVSKDIRIVAIHSENLQAKFVNQLIQTNQGKSHAIVVLDEDQFRPIQQNVVILNNDVLNVSIGQNIKNSHLIRFVNFLLQNNNRQTSKISQRSLLGQISNPIFQILLENELTKENKEKLSQEILYSSKNFIDLSEYMTKDNGLISVLSNQNSPTLVRNLKNLSKDLFVHISILDSLEKSAYVFLLECLEAISELQFKGVLEDSKAVFAAWKELIRGQKIPYESDMFSDIQIMSMLETRCLDFEVVTLVSMNEGILPGQKNNSSFFTFQAKKDFGLPNFMDQDSIMAYHFWRLLKRASNVNILYLNTKDSFSGLKERSSFIAQIENEWIKYNPNISITYPKISLDSKEISKSFQNEIRIKKSESIVQSIEVYLEKVGLSATAINDYLDCKLRFYWKNIDNVKDSSSSGISLQANEIGNIIHTVLELADQPYKGNGLVNKAVLEQIREKALNQIFPESIQSYANRDLKVGFNKILLEVTQEMLQKYFKKRKSEIRESSYRIIANEIRVEAPLPQPFEKFKIKGFIDKIELHDNELHIIDFKTGKVESTELSIKLQKEGSPTIKPKYLQLAVYDYLLKFSPKALDFLGKENSNADRKFKIYSFLNLNEKLEVQFEAQNTMISDLLKNIATELIDLNEDIFQTHDTTKCEYCMFKNICKKLNN